VRLFRPFRALVFVCDCLPGRCPGLGLGCPFGARVSGSLLPWGEGQGMRGLVGISRNVTPHPGAQIIADPLPRGEGFLGADRSVGGPRVTNRK